MNIEILPNEKPDNKVHENKLIEGEYEEDVNPLLGNSIDSHRSEKSLKSNKSNNSKEYNQYNHQKSLQNQKSLKNQKSIKEKNLRNISDDGPSSESPRNKVSVIEKEKHDSNENINDNDESSLERIQTKKKILENRNEDLKRENNLLVVSRKEEKKISDFLGVEGSDMQSASASVSLVSIREDVFKSSSSFMLRRPCFCNSIGFIINHIMNLSF